MVYCANCGAEVYGRFCAKCGAAAAGAEQAGGAPVPPAAPEGEPKGTGAQGAAPMADNAAGAICYLVVAGFFASLIFLFLEPYSKNRAIRFHAFQGLFLHVCFLALWYGISFLGLILPYLIFMLLRFLTTILMLSYVVLSLGMAYKTYRGEKMVLPVIGPLAEQQA